MVQIESLFQLGEEQICTIQEKKFTYGTNESLFRLRVEEICTIQEKNSHMVQISKIFKLSFQNDK